MRRTIDGHQYPPDVAAKRLYFQNVRDLSSQISEVTDLGAR